MRRVNTETMIIRDATLADLGAIRQIYNATILTSTAAWTEQHQTLEQREVWFATQQSGGFPVLVAVTGQLVLGFAAYGHFRGAGQWPGYSFTGEHTIHVREEFWGTGVGRALLETLCQRATDAGLHVLVAAIDSDNKASIAFHERVGFVEVARMPEVGHKFGRWLHLILMQRILDSRDRPG